jgi:hypothetical protein
MRVIVVLIVMLFSSAVHAQTQFNTTGNAFYTSCTPQNGPQYTICVFYVTGYVDGLGIANAILWNEGRPQMFCMPGTGPKALFSSISGEQSVDIIMNYLRRNPQKRHEYVMTLVIDAFKEAFPCRQ